MQDYTKSTKSEIIMVISYIAHIVATEHNKVTMK